VGELGLCELNRQVCSDKDWFQISAVLVQYTQQYEYRDSITLVNKNAKMVLDHSENPTDWKAA
jgi:hypothetical protein